MSDQQPHADRGHAEFSPSSLKYVQGCAAYHGKDGSSPAAEMGTRIHEALEVRDPSALHNEEELDLYNRCADMEDEYLAEMFVDGISEDHYEVQVDVELDGTSTFGTCDRLTIDEDGSFAVLADYKTGISTIDKPHENMQAIAYTIGVFQRFPKLQKLTFAFYVPQRHSSPLEGDFQRSELSDLIEMLSNVIKEGERVRPMWGGGQCPPSGECNPTQNCRFCRFEDRCPALGGMVLDVASNLKRKDFTNIDIEAVDDPASIEELWNISKIVEAWAKRLRARAMDMAHEGAEFPSLRLSSMGSPSKVVDNHKFIEIATNMGVDTDELLESATFAVTKTAKIVGSTADKGEKGQKSAEFLDACKDAGALEKQKERFTLR
jgi:hypothetical protein